MISFIYYYGMTSVILILIYEVLVLKDGLFKIYPSSLILRFLISLTVGPILLLFWFIARLSAHIALGVISLCKRTLDKDRVHILNIKRKYSDLKNMSEDDMIDMYHVLYRTEAMNKIVRRCGKSITRYSKISTFLYKNYI